MKSNESATAQHTVRTALELAQRGFSVFPCYLDKRPATQRGFKDATTDLDLIESWFSGEDRLIGVPTGQGNNLFVVDIDPDGLEWGSANVDRLKAVRCHQTQRGEHYLYRFPRNVTFGTTSASTIAKGIDTRGEGGYIIWWPACGLPVEGGLDDLAEPPGWLLDRLKPRTDRASLAGSDLPEVIPEGRRNQTLFREACKLRREGCELTLILRDISAINKDRCGPPLATAEVNSIAHSAMRYEPDFKSPTPPAGASASLEWLDEFRLTEDEVAAIKDPEWAITNIAPRGHLVAIAAPGGAGKTTILFHLVKQHSHKFNVVYVHADTNPADAKSYYEDAMEHDVIYLTPDMKVGKSMSNVVSRLEALANSDADLNDELWVFDTLKKMTDMIDKSRLKGLLQTLRKLSSRGMTVILLAHTNKHPDAEGNHVFEGTGDLRADVDELIYLEKMKEHEKLVVSTRPDKVRAEVNKMTFEIDNDRNVTVRDSHVDVVKAKADASRREKDEPLIEIIEQAIRSGESLQSQILAFCKANGTFSIRKVQNILSFYSKPGSEQRWVREREQEHNRLRYSLIEEALLGGFQEIKPGG